MYGLPASTHVSKQLPKTSICQALAFKPQERRQVDADVSRIDIIAQLTPQTLPALSQGKQTRSVNILRLILKGERCSEQTLRLLARIPQTVLFALAYGEQVRFALCYEGRIFTTEPVDEDEATLSLAGVSFDDLWLHLVAQVAGLDADSDMPLKAQIERRERLQQLTAECDRTERKMWSTTQTHRRNELYARWQQLNKQINELQ